MKIPLSYLFESNRYYLLAADRFLAYALTELAGNRYMEYIPHFFYYYNMNSKDECTISKIAIY